MRNRAPLLLEKKLYRAVIRAQHFFMDDHIPDPRQECPRDQEIIEAPANPAFPRAGTIRPPGVLDPLRVQVAVDVHEAMVQESLNPGALLRQKTGRPDVLFGVSQVDGHMGGVEIPRNNKILPAGMQPVTNGK